MKYLRFYEDNTNDKINKWTKNIKDSSHEVSDETKKRRMKALGIKNPDPSKYDEEIEKSKKEEELDELKEMVDLLVDMKDIRSREYSLLEKKIANFIIDPEK
ncbi:MAG: hypothetical protein KDH96_11390 [Candidatus Riesia sp.]|nr:hypothetical protein [Candidatus Riesia sp.]